MSFDERPVGIFDSGIGGLTVARLIADELPFEDLIYLGDTIHVPYGEKSREEIISYGRRIMDFMVEQGAKVIVAACNTSSSVSLPVLADLYPVPVIGVIGPGSRSAVAKTSNKRIGVLATEATVKSSVYRTEIQRLDREIEVWEVPCPELVPMVEAGLIEGSEVELVLAGYLKVLQESQVDTIVLGCTHYPYLIPSLRKLIGREVNIVDPAVETVSDLKKLLYDTGSLAGKGRGSIRYLATGSDQSFYRLGGLFMGDRFTRVEPALIF